jgi:hypothetical protein
LTVLKLDLRGCHPKIKTSNKNAFSNDDDRQKKCHNKLKAAPQKRCNGNAFLKDVNGQNCPHY